MTLYSYISSKPCYWRSINRTHDNRRNDRFGARVDGFETANVVVASSCSCSGHVVFFYSKDSRDLLPQ